MDQSELQYIRQLLRACSSSLKHCTSSAKEGVDENGLHENILKRLKGMVHTFSSNEATKFWIRVEAIRMQKSQETIEARVGMLREALSYLEDPLYYRDFPKTASLIVVKAYGFILGL